MTTPRLFSRLASIAALATLLAATLHAQTTLVLYRGGEADSGAANGVALIDPAFDSSGNNWDTAANGSGGTYTSSTTVSGSTLAYNFNDGSYLQGAELTSLTDTTSFAMELWFQAPTLSGGSQMLFMNGSSGGSGIGLYLLNDNLQVIRGGIVTTTITTLTDNSWHYVALVYDGTSSSFDAYFDSSKLITGVAGNFNNPTTGLYLGSSNFGDTFSGSIDEARIFTFANGTFTTSMLSNAALSSVPEPSTYAALAGLAALGLAVWRRRKTAA